jgi:hypothetical protein
MKKTFLLTFFALSILIATNILNTTVALAAKADTVLTLNHESNNNNTVLVSIYIENPTNQQIKSVQAWLQYDPKVLKGEKINAIDSPFDFVAPGENNFDQNAGIVKIGRSSITQGSNENKIFVAELLFTWLKKEKTDISFHNFQFDNSGNVNVMVFDEGFPVNILQAAPSPLSLEASTIPTPPKKEDPIETKQNIQNEIPKEEETLPTVNFYDLRPQNLQITSGPEYAVLMWEPQDNIAGYNIYYSNTSGRYLQRRSIGNIQEYYFDGLETGKNYYFAITAYDNNEQETDYSDEVRIKIGYPDSSTSPLYVTKSDQILKNSKRHINSGPIALIFISMIMAIGGSFMIRKYN